MYTSAYQIRGIVIANLRQLQIHRVIQRDNSYGLDRVMEGTHRIKIDLQRKDIIY